MSILIQMGRKARMAAGELACLGEDEKNAAILAIADAVESSAEEIIAANEKDLDSARRDGLGKAMLDRLTLTNERVLAMSKAVRDCALVPDPVGKTLGSRTRPNGLQITKVAVPLGVVGIIYESRPNVTVDCAVICLKAGNACILRGGKEAINSNAALVRIMRDALLNLQINPDAFQLVEDTSRESAGEMMRLDNYIDVLIPRGGHELIRTVIENSTVPVIETGAGVCHAYVDEHADITMAADIIHNGKTSRPSVCNSLECILVDRKVAGEFLPLIRTRLSKPYVELRGCPKTCEILGQGALPATEKDFGAEFLDYIMAVRVVEDIGQAIEHIKRYSSRHSEVIITRDTQRAAYFSQRVDSAAVYINASTRFTDGGEFGLGAEVGISTQKLHARGPMGVGELVSYKYLIEGDGQIR